MASKLRWRKRWRYNLNWERLSKNEPPLLKTEEDATNQALQPSSRCRPDLHQCQPLEPAERRRSSSRIQMHIKRFWQILGATTAALFSCVTIIMVADYRNTLRLRSQIGMLAIGSTVDDVHTQLGEPTDIWTATLENEETGAFDDDYTYWKYCSQFDWDGQRSRWNDAPFIPYWLSRLNPQVDGDHDSVVVLRFKDGRLVSTENSVVENLIGRNPAISF